MNRRTFLKGAGAVTVLVAGGGVWRANEDGVFSVGEGPAYEPWEDWRSAKGQLGLISAAILGASPHNTQPWLFRITENVIELYADTQRNTGALDPYIREMHIGLGCALENLMLAAGAYGYNSTANLLPGALGPIPSQPAPKLIARVELAPAKPEPDTLYDAIPRRHTNRNPYLKKPLPTDVVAAVLRMGQQEPDLEIFLFTDESQRSRIKQMMLIANDTIYADPQVQREADDRWTRLKWSDVQKLRDGLTIDTFGQSAFTTAIMKMAPSSLLEWAWRFRFWHTGYSEVLEATPLFGLIAVRDRYDQVQNLRAGRVWQRIHLWATAQGLAGRPVNEIVELIDYERLRNRVPTAVPFLATLTGDASWQPTFMFRLGYPIRSAPASPRRPVQDVVI